MVDPTPFAPFRKQAPVIELEELRQLNQAQRLARAVELFFGGRPWSAGDWARWRALTNTPKPTPEVLLNLARVVQ